MNETQTQQNRFTDRQVSFWGIVRLLLSKCYWLILSGAMIGALVFLALHFLVAPTYESRVSFYVYNSIDGTTHSGTINNNDLQAAESLAATYSKILGSNSVLDAILQDLAPEDQISRKELSEMVKASVISDTQLLEVVVRSTDPQFACRVAESFATVAPTEIVRITKAGGVEVVDRPELATEKSSPRTVFDTVLGFLIGVIAAGALLILRMVSDRTIYLPDDLADMGDFTVLGQIPEIEQPAGEYHYWKLTEGGAIGETEKVRKTGSQN